MVVSHFKAVASIGAVVIVLWVALGVLLHEDYGDGGFVYFPDYVAEVQENGPAFRAGLRSGDRMINIAGIPVEDLPLYSRWPRDLAPRAGDVLQLTAERDGQPFEIAVEYRFRGTNRLALGAGLIVGSFLVCGLWALFAVGTKSAWILAGIGMAAAAAGAVAAGPYPGTWTGVASHIQFLGTMLWTLLLFRFFLVFPTPKPMALNRWVTVASYGVWLLFFPLLVAELVFHPALYHSFGGPGSLVMFGYCILAVAAALHTLMSHTWKESRESGMALILMGIGVGVVPASIGMIDWALLGSIDIPGSAYFPLSLAAIPVFMALAVAKEARSHRVIL